MPALAAPSPLGTIEAAEESGLAFAFKARAVAVGAVAVTVALFAQWPRALYYLLFIGGLLLSGYLSYRLRRRPGADGARLAFAAVDVALVAGALFNVAAGGLSLDWPIQARMRNESFSLLLLLLGEAALAYSARRVLWTGAAITAFWIGSFLWLYGLPDTIGFSAMRGAKADEELLDTFLSPTYVSVVQFSVRVAVTLFLTALLAAAVTRSRRHLVAQVKAERLRSDLARYVSPDVADALARRPAAELGAPARREVAVLFADIVGFTRFNERLSPERTFALLRSFQERSTAAVFRHGGTLDKYLGDGFMATFGALADEPDAAARAVACAFDLMAAVERWNAERGAGPDERLRVAIGLHHGPVVVGNLGSESRLEFTAVGDVVNVASRLEEATRELGCGFAASDPCVRAAGAASRFERTVELRPRGRDAPLLVHVAGSRGS